VILARESLSMHLKANKFPTERGKKKKKKKKRNRE
jgi:hypothetical protein